MGPITILGLILQIDFIKYSKKGSKLLFKFMHLHWSFLLKFQKLRQAVKSINLVTCLCNPLHLINLSYKIQISWAISIIFINGGVMQYPDWSTILFDVDYIISCKFQLCKISALWFTFVFSHMPLFCYGLKKGIPYPLNCHILHILLLRAAVSNLQPHLFLYEP